MSTNSKPHLSIIVCTYNRDKYIYNLLNSVANNSFPKDMYEIILVNNNSTDNTINECKRFQEDYSDVRMRIVSETNQGLSYARNKGIQEAESDIIIYIDDDALVNSDFLSTYYTFFKNNPTIEAAGGPCVPKYETSEPKWFSHYTRRLITGELNFGQKIIEFPKGAFPGGGNAAYRKEVFEKVGLFNVELGRKGNSLIGAEEKDLFDKMVKKRMHFYYLPTAILYHIIPESKLSDNYFNKLTYSIGKSEYLRTSYSRIKYSKRLFQELIKWFATIVLSIKYLVLFQPQKGTKLIKFRFNVTKGLIGK